MPDMYEAHVPAEPDGESGPRLLIDRDGDVWQRDHTGVGSSWTCVRYKVQGLLGQQRTTTWKNLVVGFGPLTVLAYGKCAPGA